MDTHYALGQLGWTLESVTDFEFDLAHSYHVYTASDLSSPFPSGSLSRGSFKSPQTDASNRDALSSTSRLDHISILVTEGAVSRPPFVVWDEANPVRSPWPYCQVCGAKRSTVNG